MTVAETVAPVMDRGDAERLTNRITLMAGTIREGLEKVASLVEQARVGQAHVALGYPSWTAYLADVLGRQPIRLEAAERRELVAYLAGEGMSTRAIAPIVGVSQQAVAKSIKSQVTTGLSPAESVDVETGEITETPVAVAEAGYESARSEDAGGTSADEPARAVASAVVTGLDGKTYTRPTPSAPRTTPRRPIVDQFTDATTDLTKATDRLERLTADDRFPQNAEKAAAKNRSDLLRAAEALARVLNRLA